MTLLEKAIFKYISSNLSISIVIQNEYFYFFNNR